MPWNGSGVYSRLHSWVADAAAAIDITASRMDADTNDITSALMHCLTVNGETVPVANLPMANFRHTGASNGVALNDYATIGQIINGGGGLPAGGYLPLAGGTVTGNLGVNGTLIANGAATLASTLSVGGTGINYSGYYSGHHIAFGWDGTHLIGYVDNVNEGPVVFSNFTGNLSVSGTVSAGGVVTSGTVQGGFVNSTGNITASGTTTAAQLTSTGNINASGAIAANGNVGGGSLSVAGAGSWSNSGGWMYCSVGIQTPTQINVNGLTWSNNGGWMYTGAGVQAANLQINGNAGVSGAITASGNITANGNTVYVGGNYMQNQGDRIYHNTNMQLAGGTYWKPGGGQFADPSDIRVKKDVVSYTCGLAEITKLNPVEFAYNGRGGMIEDGRRYVGLIANDVALVMPEMVLRWRPGADADPDDPDDLLGLDASALVYALVNSVKELAAEVAQLRAGSRS